MTFDPNKQDHQWATYIPQRKPQFKTYNSRGHALNALRCKANYKKENGNIDYNTLVIKQENKLYHKENGVWCEVEVKRELKDGESLLA